METAAAPAGQADHELVSIDEILRQARQKLSPSQAARVTTLENSLSRGDLVSQKISLYGQLAVFWKDSAMVYEPYLWYLGEALQTIRFNAGWPSRRKISSPVPLR